MAKFDIRALNYTTSGLKQNTFNVEFCYTNDGMIQSSKKPDAIKFKIPKTRTFFGDVGSVESMSQAFATNKAALYDLSNDIIIHPLYNINKTKLRSTTKKPGTSENLDIYVPPVVSDVLGICQEGNYAYGLTKETQKQPVQLSIVFNSATEIDSSYHLQLSCDTLHTHLYPTMTDLTNDLNLSTYQLFVDAVPELSASRISSIFSVARNLNGIGYNYIFEMPEGTVQNEYEKGYIQCDMAVTKSPHNYLYTMQISSDDYSLDRCREYCNIGRCGDLVYLTYRDNVSYKNNFKTITYYDNVPGEYDQLSNVPVEHQLERNQPQDSFSYQHVEVLHSLHRFDSTSGQANNGHKSSLFSVKLHDTGLNESTIPETVKEKLRQNIANNIRKIAEKICPANTQLFNVYFEGK